MGGYKQQGFGERLQSAASAKKAMLDRFKARPAVDDPAATERRAERQAVSEARAARQAERQAAEQARAESEAADREAKAIADTARAEQDEAERTEREANLAIEQKAARDARYAARKARK